MSSDKLTIAICDDERNTLSSLKNLIAEVFSQKSVNTEIYDYQNVGALKHDLPLISFDLLFLDIEMPGEDGIAFSQELQKEKSAVPIIFLSNREDRVFDSFESHPFGFVRKRIFKEDINKVVEAFLSDKETRHPKKLVVKSNGNQITVLLDDIIYIESIQRDQLIHLKDAKPIVMHSTIDQLALTLKDFGFMNVFKGYIINYKFISLIRDDDILLTTGDVIPMSRRKSAETKKEYLDLLKSKRSLIF
jgi:two-component system response regulator LytT